MSNNSRPVQPRTSRRWTIYSTTSSVARAERRLEEMEARAYVRQFLNDPALRVRRPLYLVAGLFVAAAIVLQSGPILAVGLLILAIVAVPELWYAFGLRSLTFTRSPVTERATFGDVIETPLTLENRGALPLPFVEVVDNLPDDLPALGMSLDISPLSGRAHLIQAVGLWAFQRLRRRIYIRAIHRGLFTFGPTEIRVTDPFGILTREEVLPTERALIVHPLVAPVERFGLAPKALFGERASRVRLLDDPLRMSGVRQYVPGDDPRRIHWKATARAGTLQSKILDPSTQRTVMIALDVRTFKLGQMGFDPALSELAISVAASVASQAFLEGYAVGALSNGSLRPVEVGADLTPGALSPFTGAPAPGMEPRLRLEPSARLEWLTQILDGLALLLPYNGTSLANMLTEERQALPQGASLIYVGLDSLVDVPTLIALREIRSRGRDVTLLLTSREEDGEGMDAERNLHAGQFRTFYVGGRSRWRELMRGVCGETPDRRASSPINTAHVRAERAMIAEQRKLRAARVATGAPELARSSAGSASAPDSEQGSDDYATAHI